MTRESVLNILSTDLELLKQLKQLLQHQQRCITGRQAQSLQESSHRMDDMANATQQSNQKKNHYLEQTGNSLSEPASWETVAGQLIAHLPVSEVAKAAELLDTIKKLAGECRQISQDNQKTLVIQQTLTGKMLNRLRGPAADNGSAYGADGSTRLVSDSLSLAMA